MSDNIEKRAAETILQKPQEIQIGGKTYLVAPPTMATLILASELIAELPAIKLDRENVMTETLCVAKDCRVLGDILAVLILGAKNVRTTEEVVEKRLFGLVKDRKQMVVDHQAELAKKLLDNFPPNEINNLLARLLRTMQISDFFGLTTSLIEINLLRQTREVGTIPFGQ
jgi:hypothetical protein